MEDILNIDRQIREGFASDRANMASFHEQLQDVEEALGVPNLSDATRRHLQLARDKFKRKLVDVERDISNNFYLMETDPFTREYRRLLNKPVRVSFMGLSVAPDTDSKGNIVREYMRVAAPYISDKIEIHQVDDPLPPRSAEVVEACVNCGSFELDLVDKSQQCIECGLVVNVSTYDSSFKDTERVNISAKYTYDRRIHFRDGMNQFQGKQNATIPPKVYEDLQHQYDLHGLLKPEGAPGRFDAVLLEHVHMFLKETGHVKHYENAILIHNTQTGRSTNDITHLESQLMEDFDALAAAYDRKFANGNNDRKNFINSQYVLFQFLRRHRYPCRKEDFNMLKTIDRRHYHDNICSELFCELGWNHTSIF